MNSRALNIFGLMAPIWLLVGVTIAGIMYPGYSHYNQAMSELHAIGSPIQTISPIINNYPLGILFIGFGLFLFSTIKNTASKVSAALIMIHGIGSIIAGYFPCDVGCNPESTSFNQQMHGLGAVLMTLTFLIVPAIWGLISNKVIQNKWFSAISIICVLSQIAVIPLMGQALESGLGFGLYQRLGYGIPMVWLLIFSILLLRHNNSNQAQS